VWGWGEDVYPRPRGVVVVWAGEGVRAARVCGRGGVTHEERTLHTHTWITECVATAFTRCVQHNSDIASLTVHSDHTPPHLLYQEIAQYLAQTHSTPSAD